MFQLVILSGKQAGTVCVARRFPFRVGRNADADLVVDDPGVWDDHLRFEFVPGEGIRVAARPEALLAVNAERQNEARLRNGDWLDAGGLKLRFWLAEAPLRQLRPREVATWVALLLVFLAQFYLAWRLR
jgi:hypothetical protein